MGCSPLGVNGVVIIAHGSSDALAISNAIKVARETIKSKVVDEIQEEINQGGEKMSRKATITGLGKYIPPRVLTNRIWKKWLIPVTNG